MPVKIGNNFAYPTDIDKIFIGHKLVYSTTPYVEPTVAVDYLSVKALATGTIKWSSGSAVIEYSSDKSNWTTYTLGTDLSMNANDILYWRGDNNTFGATFSSTMNVELGGNIMTVLEKNGYDTTIPSNCFKECFKNSLITKAPNIIASWVGPYGCYSMFEGCSNLTAMPELPAVRVDKDGYYQMFKNCVNLTTTNNIVVSVLDSDYGEQMSLMFYGCSSLATQPQMNLTRIQGMLNWGLDLNLFGAFANTAITDLYFLSLAFLSGGLVFNNIGAKIHFGTNLTYLASGVFGQYYGGATYTIYFHFTDNDQPEFDVDNIITQGYTSFSLMTYNIYTDNTAIKNAVLQKANTYTIVSVYHLDGSQW